MTVKERNSIKRKIKLQEDFILLEIKQLTDYLDLLAIDCLERLAKAHPGKRVYFSPMMGTITFYIDRDPIMDWDKEFKKHGIQEFTELCEEFISAYGNNCYPTIAASIIQGGLLTKSKL